MPRDIMHLVTSDWDPTFSTNTTYRLCDFVLNYVSLGGSFSSTERAYGFVIIYCLCSGAVNEGFYVYQL